MNPKNSSHIHVKLNDLKTEISRLNRKLSKRRNDRISKRHTLGQLSILDSTERRGKILEEKVTLLIEQIEKTQEAKDN
jgi:hypothetical protein